MRKFLKTIPMKIYVILTAIILFLFFSNDFGLVDIQKTAIILAAAIDRSESGFTVTTQIAVPKGSDRTTGGTSSVEISADGKTVSECIANIYSKTGWVPKLVFCDLILIGEEAAKTDVFTFLNYFLCNEYMPDSCLLSLCEGKAEEVISTQSAIDDASSLAIEKLFSDAAVKSGKVLTNTLKDFAIDYYGVSKSSFLPFIRMQTQQGAQGGENMNGAGAQQEQKIYSAEQTAIFVEGRHVATLSPQQTLAFSLLQGNVFAGNFSTEENGSPVTLTVLKNEGGVSLDTKSAPQVKLRYDVRVQLCSRAVATPIEDIASEKITPEVLKNAQTTLNGYMLELFNVCKQNKCDLFRLKRSLYRSSPKQYAKWKDTLLESMTPIVEGSVKN